MATGSASIDVVWHGREQGGAAMIGAWQRPRKPRDRRGWGGRSIAAMLHGSCCLLSAACFALFFGGCESCESGKQIKIKAHDARTRTRREGAQGSAAKTAVYPEKRRQLFTALDRLGLHAFSCGFGPSGSHESMHKHTRACTSCVRYDTVPRLWAAHGRLAHAQHTQVNVHTLASLGYLVRVDYGAV